MVNEKNLDEGNADAEPLSGNAPSTVTSSAARAIAPEKRGQLYTRNAEEGLNAAELINSALKKRVLGSTLPRRIEVASPSGPSTAGGRKARQPITLVQTDAQGPAIMIGFLDVAQKTAGLREYALVAKHYQARFRAVFEATEQEYGELSKDLVGMLTTLGYKLVLDEPREDSRSTQPPAESNDRRKLLMIAAATTAAVVLMLLLARC